MQNADERQAPVVAVFPPSQTTAENPYVGALHAALERRGVQLIEGRELSPAWVEHAPREIDVVHLHWPEYVVRAYSGGRLERTARTHVRAARYVLALRRLRAAGVRTVWTVHNRKPHDSPYPWLEGPLGRHTAATMDALVLHSRTAARTLARDLRRPIRAWIAHHPHYRGLYPADGRSRAAQRASYGLGETAFVYLVFGQIRAYKRVAESVRAFRALADGNARMVIAGSPVDDAQEAEVRQAASGDPRVHLMLRFIPDDEVSALFELSDAAVLNYREIFSSGALMLALTFGVPVIAPEAGGAREVADSPAVELFAPGQLAQALGAVRGGDPASRRAAALEAIEPLTYDALADEVLRAYRGEGGTTVQPPVRRQLDRHPLRRGQRSLHRPRHVRRAGDD